MLKRTALFAIAASVGLAVLASAEASARPGQRVGIGNHARFAPVAHRFFNHHPRLYNRLVFGYRARVLGYNWRWASHPHFCWRHPLYCNARVGAYRVGVVPVIRSAPVIAPPVVPTGGCLTQIRLADGNSLFRNLCTNEAAITSDAMESAPPTPSLK